MTAADLLASLELRGVSVSARGDSLAIRPRGAISADERQALIAAKADVLALLRARAIGTDWSRVSLYALDRVLEVEVPWSDVRIILAPGCRVARELRAQDQQPGRVWCTCEVLDLLLTGVRPEDARSIGETRITFDGEHQGMRAEKTTCA